MLFLSFPIDVVKTKMQSTSLPHPSSASSSTPHPYATIRSSFKSAYQEGGYRVFVAGLGPTLVRSVPVNMVSFDSIQFAFQMYRLRFLSMLKTTIHCQTGYFRSVWTSRFNFPLDQTRFLARSISVFSCLALLIVSCILSDPFCRDVTVGGSDASFNNLWQVFANLRRSLFCSRSRYPLLYPPRSRTINYIQITRYATLFHYLFSAMYQLEFVNATFFFWSSQFSRRHRTLSTTW